MLTMGTVTLGDCNSVTACSEQAMLTTGTVTLGDCNLVQFNDRLFCAGNADHGNIYAVRLQLGAVR